jgi:hypothetical protein
MEWLVRLKGAEWSLEDLPNLFSQLDHKVRSENGKYYLSSSMFNHYRTVAAVSELAEQIVERINGVMTALDPPFHSVRIAEIVQLQEDGTRKVHHYLKPSGLKLQIKLGKPTLVIEGNPPLPQPSKPEKLVAQWEAEGNESDLGRALRIGLLPQQTWGSLYHVYEVIKHDVSGGRDDWKPLLAVLPDEHLDRQLKRFRDTANDPKHAGIHARHGKPEPKSEPDPMTIADAQILIHRLLVAWLSTKI